MAEPILMPQAGQSMTEGEIVQWFVKEGDTVRRGDPILEISTDKANMDVESPGEGVVRKIFFPAGEVVPVLQPIAVIGTADEEIDLDSFKSAAPVESSSSGPPSHKATAPKPGGNGAKKPPVAPKRPATPTPAAAKPAPAAVATLRTPRLAGAAEGPSKASPLARRLARIHGVDISRLAGTGPFGRIIRRDVEAASNGAPGALAAGAGVGAAQLQSSPSIPYPPPAERPESVVPIEGMRRAIATALQASKTQAPHFYLSMEIDFTSAADLRSRLAATGVKLSVNDFVVRAVAIALGDEPRVNCRVFEDRVEYPDSVNIGIAVGLEEGLVVPVVMGAESRSLEGIAEETRSVIESARKGRLKGSGQGTFTISNLGMFGVDSFTAIINPPEGAILAVGAAAPRLVPMSGGFFPRSILKATLSADHRAIDGMLAARFMGRVKHLLENPEKL